MHRSREVMLGIGLFVGFILGTTIGALGTYAYFYSSLTQTAR